MKYPLIALACLTLCGCENSFEYTMRKHRERDAKIMAESGIFTCNFPVYAPGFISGTAPLEVSVMMGKWQCDQEKEFMRCVRR